MQNVTQLFKYLCILYLISMFICLLLPFQSLVGAAVSLSFSTNAPAPAAVALRLPALFVEAVTPQLEVQMCFLNRQLPSLGNVPANVELCLFSPLSSRRAWVCGQGSKKREGKMLRYFVECCNAGFIFIVMSMKAELRMLVFLFPLFSFFMDGHMFAL